MNTIVIRNVFFISTGTLELNEHHHIKMREIDDMTIPTIVEKADDGARP